MDEELGIPCEIRDRIMRGGTMVLWPIDINPLSESFQMARYFQDNGWRVYPVHDYCERILDEYCYRDIRLIPDDYDILVLFMNPDQLPEVVNHIFNADFTPPIVWAHTGVFDQDSYDRLMEAGIMVVMDQNMMETHRQWCDEI